MRLFVIFGVFLTIISTAVGQDRYKFDCNRLPNSCKNGGTCESGSKECVCTADWTGYNCNHPTASTQCTTEPDPLVNPCQSSGTCYKSSDESPVALCYCKYGYYGDTCEEEIAKINCTGNIAEYSLSFSGEFIGSVVLVDENGTSLDSACPLVPSGSDRKTYALAVDITDAGLQEDVPCKLQNIMVVNDTTYQANLRVSYRPSLVTNLDEDYILNCEHTTEDVDVSIDIETVIVNDDEFGKVTANESYLPLVLEVKDANDSDIDNVLVLGERTWMHVYPRPGSEYADVLIETCTANNYLTNENETMSFIFLDRGCPTEDGNFISAVQVTKNKIITTEQGSVNVSGKAGAFSAFKFSNSDKLKIECKAKVCRSGDSSCDLPNCTAIMNEENSDGGGNTTGNTTNGGGNTTNTGGTTNGGGNTTSEGGTTNEGGTNNQDGTTNEGGTNNEGGTTNEGGTNNQGGTTNEGGTTNGESGAAGGNDGRRRKRAAEDDDTEKVVSKVFTVVGKREIKNDQTSSEQEAEPVNPVEECLARPEITAVVAVLGAVVCVLLIVCFFLVCVILKRKGKHTTTYDPTLFQPKPDRFQIPRAHVNESYEMM